VARHAEPWRVYHVLAHVLECLAEVERSRDLAEDADAIRAALWFHDAVWEPGRPDNEAASAALADRALAEAGVPEARRMAVAALILATRHHTLPEAPDDRLIADIDLAILGARPDEYLRYEQAVRREYGHLSDAAFAAGRAAFAAGLLARPRIYGTGRYHRRLEAAARANLARSAGIV
jgi:predicted metal-dependent HD superfamily phosphohydrolase